MDLIKPGGCDGVAFVGSWLWFDSGRARVSYVLAMKFEDDQSEVSRGRGGCSGLILVAGADGARSCGELSRNGGRLSGR